VSEPLIELGRDEDRLAVGIGGAHQERHERVGTRDRGTWRNWIESQVELPLQVGLLHFRQHLGDPTPSIERSRGKHAVRVVIQMQAGPQLSQVVLALETPRRLSRPLDGRQQKCDEHGQHADRDGQLDQSETACTRSAGRTPNRA